MALEIELKLSLQPQHVADLLRHPRLAASDVQNQGSRTLENTYYDTPQQTLRQQRAALRIRNKGGQYIQTLKGGGQASGGMHTRQEFEWSLRSAEVDLALLQNTSLSSNLPLESLADQLQPVFRTDFSRQTWLLTRPATPPALQIEIALDQGDITVPGQARAGHDQICELELELMQGEPEQLIALGLELARDIPLLVNDVSKAQRGYRLMHPELLQITPPATGNLSPQQQVQPRLSYWLRCVEGWQFSQQTNLLEQAAEAFCELHNTCCALPEMLPEPIQHLFNRLHPACATADTEAFSKQLETTNPGLLCLLLLQWLRTKETTTA
ncbi:inorganic triphosphatase [Pontibacter sp. JAM-7]|uniref:CYTH domain-containing protein n=1 Tax=Pontibacter sp. JAM-7 TaxID=3366581 RepID=UPI003AF5BAE0